MQQTYDQSNGENPLRVYLCGFCLGATQFDLLGQHWPQARSGNPVGNLPPTVSELYDEARACMSVRAYTSVALACRKLLMNTAVTKGAKENQSFTTYVDYLFNKGFIPPDAQPWVDHIRSTGNDATHAAGILCQEGCLASR